MNIESDEFPQDNFTHRFSSINQEEIVNRTVEDFLEGIRIDQIDYSQSNDLIDKLYERLNSLQIQFTRIRRISTHLQTY